MTTDAVLARIDLVLWETAMSALDSEGYQTWTDPAEPPSGFGPPIRISDTEFAVWWNAAANPYLWHWCPRSRQLAGKEGWALTGTGKHTLVARDPLHLEASVLHTCCGKHGYIRDGAWVSA
jgi:hypothetical protein